MLREAGYRIRRDSKELVAPRRRPTTSSSSTCAPATSPSTSARAPSTAASPAATCCSTPAAAAVEIMALGFGRSTFRYAARPGTRVPIEDIAGHRGRDLLRRASSRSTSPTTASSAEVVRLDGAVETAITLGVADVIADVVETGSDPAQPGPRGVRRADPAQRGRARAARAPARTRPAIEVLRRRLLGVVIARHYVMLDYDVPADLVDQACAHHPRPREPRPSRRCRTTRAGCAVRAMVPRAVTNTVMDELYDLGARAILVTDITACRL